MAVIDRYGSKQQIAVGFERVPKYRNFRQVAIPNKMKHPEMGV